MTLDQHDILEQVAKGELSPEDAALLLDSLREPETVQAPLPPADFTRELPPLPPPVPPLTSDVRRLRVHASAGKVTIIGDRSVAGAEVTGPHTMHSDDEELVVDYEPIGLGGPKFERAFGRDLDDDFHGFELTSPRRHGRFNLGFLADSWRPLKIRANPDLDLEVDLAAGSLTIEGMHGAVTCEVSGGSAALRDVRGPLDCKVSAGSLSVSGRIEGDSHLSCSMGSLAVRLDPGSNVRVEPSVSMGKCAVHLPLDDDDVWVAGNGDGRLVIEGSMATVSVSEA